MRLLLDTHILIWILVRDRRLSQEQREALTDPDNALLVSAATAYELTHLQAVGRIPLTEPLDRIQEEIGFELADFPAGCWSTIARLPMIHRDPIDRMLVAHALAGDFTLLTADTLIRQYPVPTI
jgi:PIN domain nuclease of toxin-antitoxin system